MRPEDRPASTPYRPIGCIDDLASNQEPQSQPAIALTAEYTLCHGSLKHIVYQSAFSEIDELIDSWSVIGIQRSIRNTASAHLRRHACTEDLRIVGKDHRGTCHLDFHDVAMLQDFLLHFDKSMLKDRSKDSEGDVETCIIVSNFCPAIVDRTGW